MIKTGLFRYPRLLYFLFFTEMWERFSFYGMKALLLAYMVTQLIFDEPRSYALLGAYAALVYTMPLAGGFMADKILGYRKSVFFGGILMVAGHFILALPASWSFYTGMAFIICGNGYFKPNISSLVGSLYKTNDPRKDSAFSFFYMGINIGAALGGAVCGYIGQRINWHLGFGTAGIFMVLGLLVFHLGQKNLGPASDPPNDFYCKKSFAGLKTEQLVYAGTLMVVPLIVWLFHHYEIMDRVMPAAGILTILYMIYISTRLDAEARGKLLAALILIIFSVLFWAFYEQNSGSLNLYAMRNVNMHFAGTELAPLAVNNFLPPFWVISLSSFFAWFWFQLAKKEKEPSTPVKFALSFLFLAAGFYIFYLAGNYQQNGMISLGAFVIGYAVIICGELCISPIGLSMVTKLAPQKMVGLLMGTWFLATASGEYLASKIGARMSVPEGIYKAQETLPYYQSILFKIVLGAGASGLLLFFLVPWLKKWMGNAR